MPNKNSPNDCIRSVSEQMGVRFENRSLRRRLAACSFILLYIIYLTWRVTIINENYLVMSVTYYIAEVIGFILGLTVVIFSLNYNHRAPKPPLQGRAVDVFIPVYLEPIDMIERTLRAAKNITYPHQTWVLDDGKRDEIQKIAEQLGIKYVRREINNHAKAGNLNHAIQQSEAEFIMVFDADHVALPNALDVTLGFFEDDKVALVQTPQDYYNVDAFQYIADKKGGLWHDQSYFYNINLACRDSYNSASCVGTGLIYRKTAIDEIGGIPTETVTEDIHTSLKLQKAGKDIVYLNEPIAYGEASPDLKEYYKTRHRWAHGNLHALQKENILFCKGLTFRQRWANLSMGLIYLEGWQQLMLFLIPCFTLVFGLQPFEINILNILIVLGFPILSYLLLQELGAGFARFWPNEIFSMARWPVHITASIGLFGKKIKWRTSSKGIETKVHWKLLLPQIFILIISIFSLVYSYFKLGGNYYPGPLVKLLTNLNNVSELKKIDIFTELGDLYTIDLVLIAGFWVSFNMVKVLLLIYKAFKNSQIAGSSYRFNVQFPALVNGSIKGKTVKVSDDFISIIFPDNKNKPKVETSEISIFIPSGEVKLKLKKQSFTKLKGKGLKLEGEIEYLSDEAKTKLSQSLYSVDWHREFLNRHQSFSTPLDFIKGIFIKQANRSVKSITPILYGDKKYGLLAKYSSKKTPPSLIVFESFEGSAKLSTEFFDSDNAKPTDITILAEESISSLNRTGLDMLEYRKYLVKIS